MKKNPFKAILDNSEPKTNDVLGAYPERVHVRAFPERRYLKTTRFMTILSVISLSVTMVLASIVYMLVPQKTATVTLITKDNRYNELKYVEDNELVTRSEDLYYEKFARDYVVLRHEVTSDIDAFKDKYDDKESMLNLRTFVKEQPIMANDLKETLNKVVEEGYTRKVNVLWAKRWYDKAPNGLDRKNMIAYIVRFETLDFYYNKPVNKIKVWESFIRISRNGKALQKLLSRSATDLAAGETYKKYIERNPFFLIVTNYALSYAGSRPLPKANKK